MNLTLNFLSFIRYSAKSWILALTFSTLSGYWVLKWEYEKGSYLYYFFKASFYYANFHKIIIPAGFWLLFLSYLTILSLKSPLPTNRWKMSLLTGVFFHIYLLAWIHLGEVLSDFSLIPIHLPSFPGKIIYERTIIILGIICYNIYGFNLITNQVNNHPFGWKVIPASILSVFIITPHTKIISVLLIVSFTIYVILNNTNWRKIQFPGPSKYYPIITVFLIGLSFRVWYAVYINSLDNLALGVSADGSTYFSSALAFSNGKYTDVDYYHAPQYALFLSLLMTVFGKTPDTIFYSQAFLGSLTPALVYIIAYHFFNKKLAFIAGLLAALSQIGIHHSVVCHRIDPVLFILPTIVILYLVRWPLSMISNGLFFGYLSANQFYLAQETLPIIIILIGFWLFRLIREAPRGLWTKPITGLLIGGLLAIAPLNLIFFDQFGKWIPLGRDVSLAGGTISVGIGNNPIKTQLANLGFEPLNKPKETAIAFLRNPFNTSFLLAAKIVSETQGFFLDPGSIYFQPLLLDTESFMGANLLVYYYASIIFGLILFLKNNQIKCSEKLALFLPILFHFLTITLILYGTFRHRVPITPFGFILAVSICNFFKERSTFESKKKFLHSNFIYKKSKTSIQKKKLTQGFATILIITCLLLIGLFIFKNTDEKKVKNYIIKQWLAIDSKKGLSINNKVSINSIVFTYYSIRNKSSQRSVLTFNICRHLMPGKSPYYRLALDGGFIHEGKPVPLGCSKVKHDFKPAFNYGMITLILYASKTGESPNLIPSKIITPEGKFIRAPYVANYNLDQELKSFTQQFKRLSPGYVKLSPPLLIKQ